MEEAQRLFELLNRELGAILALTEGNIQTEKQLRDQEQVIQTKQKDLEVKFTQLNKDKELFETEKQFLTRASAELNLKKGQLEKKELEIEEKLTQLDNRQKEIKTAEQELERKVVMAKSVDIKLEELKSGEEMLEKSKIYDRERKEMLDKREENLSAQATRLQKVAESM